MQVQTSDRQPSRIINTLCCEALGFWHADLSAVMARVIVAGTGWGGGGFPQLIYHSFHRRRRVEGLGFQTEGRCLEGSPGVREHLHFSSPWWGPHD